MKLKILLLPLLAVLLAAPAVNADNNSSLLFLNLSPGGRPTGMGWAYVAEASDVSAVYWNPAGLSFLDTNTSQLFFSYANWIPLLKDIYHAYIAYEQYWDGWGHFAMALDFISYGKMERTLTDGQAWYEFRSNEFSLTPICYSTQIAKNLSVGVGFKFIYSNLFPGDQITQAAQAFGYAVDVGLLRKELFAKYSEDGDFRSGLALGAVLTNIGPDIQYVTEQYQPLPQQFKLGAAYTVRQPIPGLENKYNDILLMWDIMRPLVNDDPFMQSLVSAWFDDPFEQEFKSVEHYLGGEYVYASWVSLRAGYRLGFKQGKKWQLADTATPTFGMGMLYPAGDKLYHFDLSYLSGSGIIENTYLFSFILEY